MAAICVAAIGIVAFVMLDGMAAGVALLVAGVLLVVIGLVGWQDRRTAPRLAVAGGSAVAALEPRPVRDPGEPGPAERGGALDEGERLDPILPSAPGDADPTARDYAPAPGPTTQVVGEASSLDHVNEQPLLGHADLVAHVGDHHEGIPQSGSTIQLRLLHERAHGAPHEPPVNLRTG